MGGVVRYQIVVGGRLGPRFAASLEGVRMTSHGDDTALLADLDSTAELDALLSRLGDLGLDVVSLGQQPGRR
jgi:hypothetical protein